MYDKNNEMYCVQAEILKFFDQMYTYSVDYLYP